MGKSKYLIVGLLFLFNINNYAQQQRCNTNKNLAWMRINAPDRYQRFVDLENRTRNYIQNQSQNNNGRLINSTGLIIIPVVVHVLHYGEPVGTGYNISLATIQSQIDVLKEDFRRLNADAVNTPSAFLPVAADLQIEFRLACIDPNGNPTDGVVRKATPVQTFYSLVPPLRPDGTTNEEAIGIKTLPNGSPSWPTERYLNIWVCNVDVLGYAQFPADYALYPQYDGIVVDKDAFGRPGGIAPNNKGRIATHEVGHWLNLEHLWGDQTYNLDCLRDDFCNDTPQQTESSFDPCPTYPSLARRCNTNDPSIMFMNYMDFVDDQCLNLFTNDQRNRARALFGIGMPREQQLINWFKVRQSKTPIRCSGVVYSSPACLPTTWSVLLGPATLIPGPGTNQATLTATGTGTVVIRATSGNYTTDDNIEVTTVPPPLTGFYQIWSDSHNFGYQWPLYNNNSVIWLPPNKGFEVYVQVTSPDHISSSSTWTRASNSYPFSWNPLGPNMNFNGMSAGAAYQDRYGIFDYTTQNSCGTFNGTYSWPVVVAGWLRIRATPNPVSDNLIVSIDEESKLNLLNRSEKVSISLYDLNIAMKVKQWEFLTQQRKFNLNVAGLKKGHYILVVRRGKDMGSKQIIIE